MQIYRNNLVLNSQQTISRFRSITAKLERAQQVATSGLAVVRPSDASGKWKLIHGLRSSLADQQRWQKSVDGAEDLLLTADSTFSAVSDLLNRAVELATQYASETYTADDRAAAAPEVSQLGQDLVALANTDLGGRYLFGGDAYDVRPFTDAGVYVGAGATSSVQVGANVDVLASIDGSRVFTGGVDVFAALNDFAAAMAANDTDAIAQAIDTLEEASAQVSLGWSDVGYRLSRLSDARTVAENFELVLQERLTQATEADAAEAFTTLSALQTNYEAALQVTASSSGALLFQLL